MPARGKRFATGPWLQASRSRAGSRDFVAQDSGVRFRVNISASEDDTGGKAAKLVPLLEERGKAGSASAFHHIVGVGEERTHRGLDFVVGDFHDAVGSGPNGGER